MGALYPRYVTLLFALRGCDFNITTDNALVRQFNCLTYDIHSIYVRNASISLTTAVGGIYTAAAKGGTAIVAAGQVYSTLTGPTIGMQLTIEPVGMDERNATALYLNLSTAQGAAATADVFVYGCPLT